MSHVLVPELQTRSDLLKILTFILHREQLPHNDRCILPYGDTTPICLDTFESCASICTKFMEWETSRVELLMNLLLLPFSNAFAGALRLRIMDHILVNGCVGIASIVIAYLHRRRDDIMSCASALAFTQLYQENAVSWLLPAQMDEFWKECSEVHRSNFLFLYSQRAIQMRAKHITFNLENYGDKFLLQQREELGFEFKNYDWIGFTVDHTLAEFKLEFLLRTSLNKAFAKAQAVYINLKTSAPPQWQSYLAHRGLAIDIVRGNFILFGSNNEVLSGYHGTEEIPLHQLNWQYPQGNRQDTQWIYIYTTPEMIYPQLFAWLVDQYERGALTNDEIGYIKPSDDINHEMAFILPKSAYAVLSTIAMDASTAYYESDFLPTLLSTPEILLHYNPNTRKTLESFVYNAKKKLFLLTNSSWEHVNAVS
ncbi:hypothetical protein THRCLA_10989 [Thraustotheca clavata]|uniref:Uncharacterized protein n=1 Tax=Thraustotheca clavata TaxID=74557 RepID=A0A1V9YBJ8_9STRA|nr:hypothetical protein THRCLA_10989 [Thraustotheca clavata]